MWAKNVSGNWQEFDTPWTLIGSSSPSDVDLNAKGYFEIDVVPYDTTRPIASVSYQRIGNRVQKTVTVVPLSQDELDEARRVPDVTFGRRVVLRFAGLQALDSLSAADLVSVLNAFVPIKNALELGALGVAQARFQAMTPVGTFTQAIIDKFVAAIQAYRTGQ